MATASPSRWSARTACASRPSGRACSATRASRSARSGSSRRRSSTSSAAGWSRTASSTRPAVDARGDPQVRQLVRREQAPARALDRGARVRGQGRPQGAGRRAVVRRRLRVVRPALAAASRRALARLFHEAGVDFGILYDGERNSGNDVRRVGEEGLFELLAEHNIETLSGCEFNRIVTTDPHSLNTLRNEYPQLGGEWQVIHHTALLLELIESGRLDSRGAARLPRHLPRPLPPRAHQRRVRRPRRHPRAARLHAGRDAAQPRQLASAAAPAAGGSGSRTRRGRSGRPRTGSARRCARPTSSCSSSPARRT